MKAQVISLDGKKTSEIELPKQFSEKVDETLIKRAVLAIQSAKTQDSYPTPSAGRANTAEYIGNRQKPQQHRTINVGHARKPRLKNRRSILSGQVASIPAVVGGPKAHPPKPNKIWEEKINKKEKRKATNSAIAATMDAERAKARGHRFDEKLAFPIIIEAKLEDLDKTKNVKKAFQEIGVWSDVEKALAKKQIRPGIGKRRTRRYKKRKSILIVAGNTEKVFKGARNLEGVDITSVREINADLLAPGAVPGRLTLWSEKAIKEMGEEKKAKKEVLPKVDAPSRGARSGAKI